MNKMRVGIIGAAGYTAGELIRILVNHPGVELVLAQSNSQSGKKVSAIHTDLVGETGLIFTSGFPVGDLDVAFLCKGHGESINIIKAHPELLNIKLVDLSQDFRLIGDHDFIYGLPEINRETIASAAHIANPGCFATCIQLGILPAIHGGLVNHDIHVSGITGSTGAGQALSNTSHFSWRSNNAGVYKPFAHQHLHEIRETVQSQNGMWNGKINFIPYRGAFTRGIITTSYFETDSTESQLKDCYESAYENEPFTHMTDSNPDLKMVVNTNKAVIYPAVINGHAMVISVIDNLLKGASGQAVQNMNLLFGLEENTGLNLKASAF
ncbi:MAG: N-acetyl-gamma-glutamyl-phosphate reductase [Cyclobacteriaceae bacterium]